MCKHTPCSQLSCAASRCEAVLRKRVDGISDELFSCIVLTLCMSLIFWSAASAAVGGLAGGFIAMLLLVAHMNNPNDRTNNDIPSE